MTDDDLDTAILGALDANPDNRRTAAEVQQRVQARDLKPGVVYSRLKALVEARQVEEFHWEEDGWITYCLPTTPGGE